jgi:hypothetical protein
MQFTMQGKCEDIIVAKVEMDDPTFESGTVHTARATFTNPKTAPFTYGAQLYLGKTLGDKKAASSVQTFTLNPGASVSKDFSVTMPVLTVVQDSFHVYLLVTYEGTELITYVSTEDVVCIVSPGIQVGTITWVS